MEPRSSYGSTCVCSDNLDLIEQALTRILEQEGCRRISKPSLPQNSALVMEKLRSFPSHVTPYLWVFGLIFGRFGWIVVQSWPSDLLCQRARGATRPLLSELAMQTGCDAFHCMRSDRYWGAVLEADASGRTFASGNVDCMEGNVIKTMRFYDEPIIERTGGLDFFLLNVPLELQMKIRDTINYGEGQRRIEKLRPLFRQGRKQVKEADSELEQLEKSAFSEERERRLKKLRVLSEQGRKQVEEAESELEQLQESALKIDEISLTRLPLRDPIWDQYYGYCGDLPYKVYHNPQQLEADGVRLLYFQPVNSSGADMAEIWEEMSRNAPAESEENINEIPFVRAVDAKSVRVGLQDAWEYEANRPQVGWEWRKF